MAEKPSLDVSAVAAHLNRSGGSWSQDLGQATSVTFGFRPDAPNYAPAYPGDYVRLEEPQIVIALLSFQSWSDVANITFTRVGSGTSGDAAYTEQATMLLGGFDNGPDIGAYAYIPGQNGAPGSRSVFAPDGDAYFNLERSNIQDPEILWGMRIFTHELGHAIGLDHAGDYAAGQGVTITYEQHAEYIEDTSQYTVMSYFDESKTGADYGALTPGAPQLHDIAAAQRLYGVNMSTRTGDTVYGFNSNADRPWLMVESGADPVIFCAWDAGGRDTFDFSGFAQDQLIDLGQGKFSNVGAFTSNVSIAFGAVIEDAIGGSGDDEITGNAAANRLSGGAGNDRLVGLDGADTLAGGAGLDTLEGGLGVDAASFLGGPAVNASLATGTASGAGTDTLSGIEILIGSDFSDALTGSAAANTLQGGKGADSLDGGAGDDRLEGGEGLDTVRFSGSGPAVTVNLGAGTATGRGSDTLVAVEHAAGTAGADALTGSSAANRLQGGEGDDTLDGAGGDDQLEGGAGEDMVRFAGAGAAVAVDLAAGTASGRGADTLGSIEHAQGSGEADSLIGSAGANRLEGGGGDDLIDGGKGPDTLDGGAGVDTVRYAVGKSGVTVDLLAGSASGGAGTDVLAGFEHVLGSAGDDTLSGSNTGNQLSGSKGNDSLSGAGGADTLVGGKGADQLTGGSGADTLVYGRLADSRGGAGADLVLGLASADVIDLSAVDADKGAAGDQAFVLAGAFSREAGQLVLRYNEANGETLLAADVDGDGRADFAVRLAGDQTGFDNFVL